VLSQGRQRRGELLLRVLGASGEANEGRAWSSWRRAWPCGGCDGRRAETEVTFHGGGAWSMEEVGQALVWLPGSIGSHDISPDLGRAVAAHDSRGGGAWRAKSQQVGQQCTMWLAAAHGVVVRCWAPLASLEA
jgi:hypothetical protein